MCSVFQQPPGRLNSQHQGLLGVSPPTGCGLVIHSQPVTVLLDLSVPSPLDLGGLVNSLSHYYSVSYRVRHHWWPRLGPSLTPSILTASQLVLSRQVRCMRCGMLLSPETPRIVAAVLRGNSPVLWQLVWPRHPELLQERYRFCLLLVVGEWPVFNISSLALRMVWAWGSNWQIL